MFPVFSDYKTSVALILILGVALTSVECDKKAENTLVSTINSDRNFTPLGIDDDVYAIKMKRQATTRENQQSKCRVSEKKISVPKSFEKFRVGAEESRQKSVYESLTTLKDYTNGITAFEVLGNKVFVVLANGTAYFLNKDNSFEASPEKFNINLNLSISNENKESRSNRLTPKIAKIGTNAFIATTRQISYCQPSISKCTKLTGYSGVPYLYNFYAFQEHSTKRQFLFILSGKTIHSYKLTSDSQLVNEKTYTCSDFKLNKCFFNGMVRTPGNKFLFMNFYEGLIRVDTQQQKLNVLDIGSVKLIYEQYGCFKISFENEGNYLAMLCSLTRKSYFIIQVMIDSYGEYRPQEPIFFDEPLTGISLDSNIVMAHIFSGMKLFWKSNNLDSPYPFDYHNAGKIFLHNAKDARIAQINHERVIYISTEEQLRVYYLTIEKPTIQCFSTVSIEQKYEVEYIKACQIPNPIQITCSTSKDFKYIAWEHQQIQFTKAILPLIISVVLVAVVGYFLWKLHKRYKRDVEEARLKYNTDNQFGFS